VDWFKKLREQVGIESWLCALIAIAGADEVLQHGINETMINRTSTVELCLKKPNNTERDPWVGEYIVILLRTKSVVLCLCVVPHQAIPEIGPPKGAALLKFFSLRIKINTAPL
jgi:hypothetical protein